MNNDDLMVFEEDSTGRLLAVERTDDQYEFNSYLFDKNKNLIDTKIISTLFDKSVSVNDDGMTEACNGAMKLYGINKTDVLIAEKEDVSDELGRAKEILSTIIKDKSLMSDLSDVLESGEIITRKNSSLDSDVRVKRGGINEGLVHLIDQRIRERVLNKNVQMDEVQAKKETSAVLFLAIDNIDKAPAVKEDNGHYAVYNRGIKTVIGKDKNGRYVVTGYDNNQTKQEATESINAVIAQYGNTPEFLGIYAQVGAVIASYNIVPQSQEKSSNKKETVSKSTFNNLAIEYNGLLKEFDENIKDYNTLLTAYNIVQEENKNLKNQIHSHNKNNSTER